MDKKYLDKVIDQLVRETKLDYDKKTIHFLFFSFFPFIYSFTILFYSSHIPSFFNHCRDVYGLKKEEIDYVWQKYKNIIKDKTNNG